MRPSEYVFRVLGFKVFLGHVGPLEAHLDLPVFGRFGETSSHVKGLLHRMAARAQQIGRVYRVAEVRSSGDRPPVSLRCPQGHGSRWQSDVAFPADAVTHIRITTRRGAGPTERERHCWLRRTTHPVRWSPLLLRAGS